MLALPSPQPSPPPLFSSSASSSASSILLIIVLIIAFAVLASVSFHLLLRHLFSGRRSSSPPPPSLPFPPPSSASVTPPPSSKDHLVSLSASAAAASALPKSPDCAVCLSPFCPRDDLRLLPSCRHAFHLKCIDLWLQSTPSCPLCRSPADACGSSSFHTEIQLSYSLESSLEHLVGDQMEDRLSRSHKDDNGDGGEEQVPEEVDAGAGRGWLRDYLDRVASSASSSFNSLTFSGRLSSHRFDSPSVESVAAGDSRSWDLEGGDWVEETGLAGIYRWFVGI